MAATIRPTVHVEAFSRIQKQGGFDFCHAQAWAYALYADSPERDASLLKNALQTTLDQLSVIARKDAKFVLEMLRKLGCDAISVELRLDGMTGYGAQYEELKDA